MEASKKMEGPKPWRPDALAQLSSGRAPLREPASTSHLYARAAKHLWRTVEW